MQVKNLSVYQRICLMQGETAIEVKKQPQLKE